MGGEEPADPDTDGIDPGLPAVSRRAVLASSAAASVTGVPGTAAATGDGSDAADVETVLLRRSDLAEPESYVEWSIETTAAPLSRHVASAVEGFVPGDGVASGFVAKSTADGPGTVESAAYPDRGLAGVTDAAGAWVRAQSPAGAETARRGDDGTVRWETASEEGFDVLHFERLPGIVAFVGVSGEDRTRVREATDRYAGLVRTRARR
ncbi:hypothetical protein [Natronomonas marina]|jgi:hypothetical protein|uniref:hypothetical protein n=1 Tax=Natronomonas marina TaxID=2961939 RepID=UPI0020C958CD|nr:hypothetical protein [Natronomonas marina]